MRRAFLLATGAVLGALGLTVLALTPARLSPETVDAAVDRTEAALEAAWRLPVAATFQRRIDFQSNESLCGPASLANLFRSLGESSTTESTVLAGSGRCWTGFCILGLTLDELADVARARTRRKVTVLRGLSRAEFHEHLRRSNDPGRRYVVNFSREAVFGAGVGHFSPLGGYLEVEDRVFVLDVGREFRPWLIDSARLFAAIDTFDGDQKRGLLLIE